MGSISKGGYTGTFRPAKIEYLKDGATNRGFVSLDPERQPEVDEFKRTAGPTGGARRTSVGTNPGSRLPAGRSTGGFSRGNA